MTQLETDLREAFHEDPSWRSADALLDDVRRGARRRRVRRTTGLVAAAALVLATVGGGVAWHRGHVQAAGQPRAQDHATGAWAVAVTGDGTVFKVVANEGCALPCSTIWKQAGGGAWTRLASFHDGAAQSRFFGPLMAIEMSPGGRDGWAWGTRLWSTHDGGVTWSRVTSLPGDQSARWNDLDLVPGNRYTWARIGNDGTRQLWRTPTGSDDWTRIALPPHATSFIAEVLPDSRVAIPIRKGVDEYRRVRRHGKVVRLIERYAVGDGNGSWQRVMVPCYRVTYPFVPQHQRSEPCGPNGRIQAGGSQLLGPQPTDGSQRFEVSFATLGTVPYRHSPVGRSLQLAVSSNQAFLGTPHGAVPIDLRLDSRSAIPAAAAQGRFAAIVSGDHRVYVSRDHGRTWQEE